MELAAGPTSRADEAAAEGTVVFYAQYERNIAGKAMFAGIRAPDGRLARCSRQQANSIDFLKAIRDEYLIRSTKEAAAGDAGGKGKQ